MKFRFLFFVASFFVLLFAMGTGFVLLALVPLVVLVGTPIFLWKTIRKTGAEYGVGLRSLSVDNVRLFSDGIHNETFINDVDVSEGGVSPTTRELQFYD